ncbi:hypothetical protein EVG20_g10846, partial [Dentipellis fragilis]
MCRIVRAVDQRHSASSLNPPRLHTGGTPALERYRSYLLFLISLLSLVAMSIPESETTSSSSKFLFTPPHGKDRKHVFSQQPLERRKIPRYLIPLPSARVKPPELKYGWRIGEKKFWDLIHSHFEDAIQYSMFPELDDDGNEPETPPEEPNRLYIESDATFFGLAIIDSILKYLDIKVTDAHRSLIKVDYLCDSEGKPDIGLVVASTYTNRALLEPYFSKLKNLVSPNEDAK